MSPFSLPHVSPSARRTGRRSRDGAVHSQQLRPRAGLRHGHADVPSERWGARRHCCQPDDLRRGDALHGSNGSYRLEVVVG
jgi:hypothetical protein